jgi:hypothetical protein
MAQCIAYNCNALEDHTVNDCGETMKGGGRESLVFTCDSSTLAANDFDNDTLINADIASGKAVLFQEVKIGIGAPSPVDQGSTYIAGNQPKTVTYDWTGTWMDENVSAVNDSAYEVINATSGFQAGAILIKLADEATNGQLIVPSSGGVLFKGGTVIPDDNTDDIHYEYNLSYKSTESPKVQTLPTGIFSS